ncbi:MAG: DMT family transporter [Rhodovibrionaceae bacterium]
MTAFGWGTADFIARFTGRAMGHAVALVGMLLMSGVVLTGAALAMGLRFDWTFQGAELLLLAGVGIMAGTLLLYWGLSRGPVTIVAPIVGSYPALNLLIAVTLGVRPTPLQWGLMLLVLAGVVVVSRASKSFEDGNEFTPAALRKTVIISLGSAVGFALGVAGAQYATPIYGEWQTVILARWLSLAFAVAFLLLQSRRLPAVPLRWTPLLLLQGILDGGAYLALVYGSSGIGAALTVVVASSFSAITVLLARLILREAMTWGQWGGILTIVGGVAALASFGG